MVSLCNISTHDQLEFKLKSTDEAERMGSVSLLARMFSEKDSMLAVNHRQLWQVATQDKDCYLKCGPKCISGVPWKVQ